MERTKKKKKARGPFFHPIHILPPYNSNLRLPVAEKLSAMGLNLPSGPRLSENQIEEVVKSLIKASKS